MIQEIINYTKYLKENSLKVFEDGLELKNGIYLVFSFENENINLKESFIYGKDEKYISNPKELAYKISKAWTIDYKKQPYYQKCFDLPQKRIHSISPFLVAFKRTYLMGGKEFEKTKDKKEKKNIKNIDTKRIEKYLNKAIKETIINDDDRSNMIAEKFKNFLSNNFDSLILSINTNEIKNDEYIHIILDIEKSFFELTFSNYLKVRAFNSAKENLISTDGQKIKEKDILKHNEILGMSNYFNGYNIDKPFKRHITSYSYINHISNKDAEVLFEFKELVSQKVFPNPLPIFIDKDEFGNTDEIIDVLRENKDKKLRYSQILKKLFKENNDKTLQNYYLLFFNYKYELEDFDFVSKFRYSLKDNDKYPNIKNLFEIKINKDELKRNYDIKNIFYFEADIVKTIFNGVLVGGSIEDKFWVNYFNEIKPHTKDKNGDELSEPIYQMILKYRKVFYDYIYKSKTQAISCVMWDEIMWNSIIGDLRNTNFDKKYFIEQGIKEKLNIWFSLYNYFTNNKNRNDMASKIPELLEKMKRVANDENAHFETTEEFAFGAGQIIRKVLDKSEAGERTHALLEPFLQKTNTEQLNLSIARTFETYKHGFKFYRGDNRYSFDKIFSEVMGFETEKNLKPYLPMILAGYFAKSTLGKSDDTNDNEENN